MPLTGIPDSMVPRSGIGSGTLVPACEFVDPYPASRELSANGWDRDPRTELCTSRWKTAFDPQTKSGPVLMWKGTVEVTLCPGAISGNTRGTGSTKTWGVELCNCALMPVMG